MAKRFYYANAKRMSQEVLKINCPVLYNYIFAGHELPRDEYPERLDYFRDDLGYNRIKAAARAS